MKPDPKNSRPKVICPVHGEMDYMKCLWAGFALSCGCSMQTLGTGNSTEFRWKHTPRKPKKK